MLRRLTRRSICVSTRRDARGLAAPRAAAAAAGPSPATPLHCQVRPLAWVGVSGRTFANRCRFLALALASAAGPAAAQRAAEPGARASAASASASGASASASAASASASGASVSDAARVAAGAPAASGGERAPTAGAASGKGGERAGGDAAVRVIVLPWGWLSAEPVPAPGTATVSLQPAWAGTFSWAAPASGAAPASVAGGTIGLAPGLGWVLLGANVPGPGGGSGMLTGLKGAFSPGGAPWLGTLGGGYVQGGARGAGAWGEFALSAEAGRWQGGVTARGFLPAAGGASAEAAAGAFYQLGDRFRLGAEAGAFAGGGRVTPFLSPALDARVGGANAQVRVGPRGVRWQGAFLRRAGAERGRWAEALGPGRAQISAPRAKRTPPACRSWPPRRPPSGRM